MNTIPLPLAHVDLPITRVDEQSDVTVVEGYAYVNATVPGDRYDLTRAAMEEATADYLRWGAIREMHGPNAIGRCLSADWDEKGCRIIAEIVDDGARKKVHHGVLKAFSVGVQPLLVRGRQVAKGQWREVSLVDRPKDEDCPFAVIRFDDAPAEDEVPVEIEEAQTPESRIAALERAFAEFQTEFAALSRFEAGDPLVERLESLEAKIGLLLARSPSEEFVGRRAVTGARRPVAAAFRPVERAFGGGEVPVDHATEIARLQAEARASDEGSVKIRKAVEIARHQAALDRG